MNVLEDPAGLDELRALGARSVPVLSRGDKFVFAQSLKPIVEFLGLDEKSGPELPPRALFDRLDKFMTAQLGLLPLMPDDRLATHVPNRPRSYRHLGFHIFRIVEGFLDATQGIELEQAVFAIVPPDDVGTAKLVAYGAGIQRRFRAWWEANQTTDGMASLPTYYGPQTLHELLERTTWHSGQHVRQWMMLLEREGVAHHRPLVDADFAGLPMPSGVWDG